MHKKMIYFILVILAVVASLIIYELTLPTTTKVEKEGLTIIVTFPSLKPDIEEIKCDEDSVIALVPEGVDPHDYQLSPKDVQLLKRASIIISTGHAPFESQIKSLIMQGEINAELIEIPSIPGITIKKNPIIGSPNYHMPIYDPYNYIVYINFVSTKLSEKRPECNTIYKEKTQNIVSKIEKIIEETKKYNITAAAASPLAQYAVEWAGVKIKYLFQKEHNMPATPEDIASIERAAAKGEIGLIVSLRVKEKTPILVKAEEIAKDKNIPIIYIPSPLELTPTYVKISKVADQLNKIKS